MNCSKQRQDQMTYGMYMLKSIHDSRCPNIIPAVEKMDYVCSPDMANHCISHFGEYLTSASGTKESNKKTCQ